MIGKTSNDHEKRSGRTLFPTLRVGTFVVVLTLLAAIPLHADTFYSGAAVNSDGSVRSWGVTSACSMTNHLSHTSSTLTSPNGRHVSSSTSGGCVTEVDLYLAFSSTDTGTYAVVSYHSAFCPVLGRWFWNGNQSHGSGNNAYPVNFTQNASHGTSDGELYFLYRWQSSSGNASDIAGCLVGEYVTYPGYVPGQQKTYWWPSPPWQPTHSSNPWQDSVMGNQGPCQKGGLSGPAPCIIDTQEHSSFVASPTKGDSFDAQQKWWYQCPGGAFGGVTFDLTAYTTIHRSVTQNGSTFTYQVTKSGASSSCVLGQTCAGP